MLSPLLRPSTTRRSVGQSFLELFGPTAPATMHPRNRQDDFWITVSFFIVLFSFKVQESISDHSKISHLALFKKNQKLTILHLILNAELTR